MKKTLFLFLWGLCSPAVFAGHFSIYNSIPLTSADAGGILFDDCLYYFTGDTLRISNNETGGSALNVAILSTSYLYVDTGQVLILQGGNGDGIRPGGAGIYVPMSSTLYLLGGGTIISNGGNAGLGTQGMMGMPGLILTGQKFYMGGIGGYGGSGGGGAGAGIGTNGGLGGLGGFLRASWPRKIGEVDGGNSGHDGLMSLSGAQGGKVYIVGTLTVTAVGGKSSTKVQDPAPGFISMKHNHYLAWDLGKDEVIGGGGAGGNGNNGLAGMNFGGGGAGAGGAGGGGSGGVATVRDLDFKYLMQKGKIFFTGATIDALVLFLTKNPFAWKLLETPLVKALLQYISGGKITQTLDMLLHMNSHPYQFNGGGGEGSFSPYSIAPQVNGIGVWYGDIKFTDGNKNPQHLYFGQGGKMGPFGTSYPLVDLKRSPLAIANQQMDVFTTYPKELIDALTFDLYFDTANVDPTQPHKSDTLHIVYSDTLPRCVPVPRPIEDAQFLGYADEEGNYWYDQQGNVINNATDSLGHGIALYLTPEDVDLEPRWSYYSYIRVNHWIEGTGPSIWTDGAEYSIKHTQTYKGLAGNLFIAQAMEIPHFIPLQGSDSLIILPGDTNIIDLYYDRVQPTLAWSIPASAKLLESIQTYTPAGPVRYGARIKAPEWAVDKATGGYYHIQQWQEEGTGRGLTDTMPSYSVTYVPVMNQIPAAISVINNDSLGTIVKMPSWLGTNIDIEVQPKSGYELDTSYVFFATSDGHYHLPITEIVNNRLTLYATPLVDSAVVWVRYRGVKHQMNYTESGSYRLGSMTWFINGDSIDNDEGISGAHDARTGDRIWIRPEAQPTDRGSNVCKRLVVTTLSGDTIAAAMEEYYDAMNHYEMHYSFIMPDENVNIVSTYGTLSDELTRLRVVCDTGEIKVYSTRGRLLRNDILMGNGYKVDAGQLVWIQIANDTALPGLDSIRLRYYDGHTSTFEPISAAMYIKTMQDTAQPIDTTVAATIFPKFLFRMPPLLKEVTVEIHHEGTDLAWEEDPTSLYEHSESVINPHAIYDIYGRYWGTQTEGLPAGIYLRGGKKWIVY